MIDVLGFSRTWALTPDHLHALAALQDAGARGARVNPQELTALLGFPDERPGPERRGRSVGIVSLRGLLVRSLDFFGLRLQGGTETFRNQLREAVRHRDIETILLDVDSPGGSTDGIEEAAEELFQAKSKKRVVASINALGASAAYWIASQASEIAMTPSGHAGSIGVLAVHVDASEKAEKEGIRVSIISAGRYKAEGNEFAPLTAEARAHLQALIDDRYRVFVDQIARGRKVSTAAVERDFGQGRILTAHQALAARMVDRAETFDATLARLTGERPRATRPSAVAADLMLRCELDALEREGRRQDEWLQAWERNS